MVALSTGKARRFERHAGSFYRYTVESSAVIHRGSAVGVGPSQFARPLQDGDAFVGFAEDTADNRRSEEGASGVRVRTRGVVELSVGGVVGVADVGAAVYASDDDTFTLTQDSHTKVGEVCNHVGGTRCEVWFEGAL